MKIIQKMKTEEALSLIITKLNRMIELLEDNKDFKFMRRRQ